MARPSDDRLHHVFNILEPYIERVYGLPVVIKDVPAPFTGDLDGAEIHIDYAEDIENAVFILVHLFGHTVQWNVSEEAREVGQRFFTNATDEELAKVRAYEVTACRYSIQLCHDAGILDLDPWLSDFAACDYAYLEHFYRTGEKRPFKSFWRDDQPVLAPLAIPQFHPTRWVFRQDGVVI